MGFMYHLPNIPCKYIFTSIGFTVGSVDERLNIWTYNGENVLSVKCKLWREGKVSVYLLVGNDNQSLDWVQVHYYQNVSFRKYRLLLKRYYLLQDMYFKKQRKVFDELEREIRRAKTN